MHLLPGTWLQIDYLHAVQLDTRSNRGTKSQKNKKVFGFRNENKLIPKAENLSLGTDVSSLMIRLKSRAKYLEEGMSGIDSEMVAWVHHVRGNGREALGLRTSNSLYIMSCSPDGSDLTLMKVSASPGGEAGTPIRIREWALIQTDRLRFRFTVEGEKPSFTSPIVGTYGFDDFVAEVK
jgi:hypothetical protein